MYSFYLGEGSQQTESESPIWRPLTSTPVVPLATTSSSGLPTGGTTVGGAALGAAQIVSTPAVLSVWHPASQVSPVF